MAARRPLKRVVFSVLMLTFGLLPLRAQTIKARVSVQFQHLQATEQDFLEDLGSQLEDYINDYTWSDLDQDIVIQTTLQIIIETVTNRGSDRIYRAQFLISSPSGENFYDKGVEFTYQRSESMDHQRPIFDPLLSLVDYYIYMIMAGEMDTYIQLGGSHFYDEALNIANQGLISRYQVGWRSRLDEVKQITDGDHANLRQAKYFYYDCLYYVEEKHDKVKAREDARKVVDYLAAVQRLQPDSKALKRFFDAHYQELCKLFRYDEDNSNIKRLIRIDDSHRETYERCK